MQSETNRFVADMHEWHGSTLGQRTVKALQKNHFDARWFERRELLILEVLQFIKPGMTVAFGGSQSLRQLGIPEKIADAGGVILDHNAAGLSAEQKLEIMRRQQVCDVFISSSNAITTGGELYNVDGNGNRISAMIFGPRKVIVVAGVNKICHDEATAWERIKSTAAPINMKRLSRTTPCTTTGYCGDCSQPDRGCNVYLVLRKKPSLTDFSVYLVNEKLGF